MDDHLVVDRFVTHLSKNGHPGLRVNRRPDADNRSSADIDAVAGPFAIEHTSIDTIPNQRRNEDWFRQALEGIACGSDLTPPCRLRLTIEYTAVQPGQDWAAIRQAMRHWLGSDAPRLPDGRHVLSTIPGLPFTLRVTKTTDSPPALCWSRFDPEDDTLAIRVQHQLSRKAAKLAPYHVRRYTTVLLIETADLALMNPIIMAQALGAAFPTGLPDGVDEVWLADTSDPHDVQFLQCGNKAGWKDRPT